jgi:dCTP deaminase
MTVLSPQTIREYVVSHRLIIPCLPRGKQNGMSYGLTQAGYDIRIAQRIVLYPITLPNLFIRMMGSWFGKKWRLSFALGSTIERFVVPNNMIFQIVDKSTWARRGLAVQNTQAEPGWEGHLTMELSNHGERKLIIEAGDPIAQAVFHLMDVATEFPYAGKYNNQPNYPVPDIREYDVNAPMPKGTALPPNDPIMDSQYNSVDHYPRSYGDNRMQAIINGSDKGLTIPRFIRRKPNG